ncbi:MAG: nitroreductase [Deltaproteobacteria bacterium]|nr:nitroreductase [Deltaproteobacteria bacterium]
MDIIEAISKRKSIRDYKPDPVSREILTEILQIACQAPSSVNSQPWEFAILSGEVLEKIKRTNIELLRSETPPNPDIPLPGLPRGTIYYERQVEIARQLFTLMDIPREDKVKRFEWMERGFKFFNAPVAIIIMIDRAVYEAQPFLDIGSVMQTICLAAMQYGLGTCIEDQGIQYPDEIRKTANIPENKLMVISIAIGYPNWDFPANEVESTRVPLNEITTWRGFK